MIGIVDANPVSGPMSYYPQPNPIQHTRQQGTCGPVTTHRYAGGIAKIRLIKRMAKQLSPRPSPKAVGPRVPVENLVVTKKTTESNLLVNSTASEGIRYYARHDADIRREP